MPNSNKTLYIIRDWDSIYENHESRKRKHLEWVPLKNKHDGLMFRKMADRKDRCEIFSGFILLVEIASKCPTRGQLSKDTEGNLPLSPADAAYKTGFPAGVFEKALSFLSGPEDDIETWIIAKNGQSAGVPADHTATPACPAATSGLNGMEGNGMEENRSVKERKVKKIVYTESFETFWNTYPKKEGKGYASECFERINTSELFIKIIAGVERYKAFLRENPSKVDFIPNPSTWLNQRRWEDQSGINLSPSPRPEL